MHLMISIRKVNNGGGRDKGRESVKEGRKKGRGSHINIISKLYVNPIKRNQTKGQIKIKNL